MSNIYRVQLWKDPEVFTWTFRGMQDYKVTQKFKEWEKWLPKLIHRKMRHHFGLFFSSWKFQDVTWKTGKKNTIIVNFNEKHECNYQLLQQPLPECRDQRLSKPIPDQVARHVPLIPTCFQSLMGYRGWSWLFSHKALSEIIHSLRINHQRSWRHMKLPRNL